MLLKTMCSKLLRLLTLLNLCSEREINKVRKLILIIRNRLE